MLQLLLKDFSFDSVSASISIMFTDYSRSLQMCKYYICEWCMQELRLQQIEKIIDEEERGRLMDIE